MAKAKAAEAESIFPASEIRALALQWKELNREGLHEEAMPVLEEIVEKTTDMLIRLAQHEGFHNTVELDILVSSAQQKIVRWLKGWTPALATTDKNIFSYFSKCARNCFLSEVGRVHQYRKRYTSVGDDMEKHYGAADPEVNREDLAYAIQSRLSKLTCRWGSYQELGAIRFLMNCVITEGHNRARAIKGAAFAYGISMDMAKFFYGWVITALRHATQDMVRIPIKRMELLTAAFTYEPTVNLIEHYDNIAPQVVDLVMRASNKQEAKKLVAEHLTRTTIAGFGGQRVPIPSVAQLNRLDENYRIYLEVISSDQTPEDLAEIAKRFKRTPRSARDAFKEIVHLLNPTRCGSYKIYPEKNGSEALSLSLG